MRPGFRERKWVLSGVLLSLLTSVVGQAALVADGISLRPLSDDGKTRAVSWAYHGDLICLLREVTGTQSQLVIAKSDGSDPQAVTQIGGPFYAEWSWAGDKLAYEFSNANNNESQAGIFVYDVATGRSMSVSAPYPRNGIDSRNGPVWSADDQLVAYTVRAGAARKRQVWVAEANSGKNWQILPERGEVEGQRWSPYVPARLAALVAASGGGFDAATVGADGTAPTLLTDIGAQSIDVGGLTWSPTGERIAFSSDMDMTQTERNLGGRSGNSFIPSRSDCFIVRPDGSDRRNLTLASSPATEEQLSVGSLTWSWDGRWIISSGYRFDNQGNSISTLYLIDPVNGGYEPLITSDPQRQRQLDRFRAVHWSYDSTKLAILSSRYIVKNWGPEAQYETPRTVLTIYDVRQHRGEDILIFDEQLDRRELLSGTRDLSTDGVSWSPDSRSLLLTIGTILSADDNIVQPDVYRLDLPDRFVGPTAAQFDGPPIGNGNVAVVRTAAASNAPASAPVDNGGAEAEDWDLLQITSTRFVTETLRPVHMTVEEAIESLPAGYQPFFTSNVARNTLLFKGPAEILESFRRDLQLIDTAAPHILVDMLAVELSDEANQELGLDWTYAEGHFAFFQPAGRGIQQFPHVSGDDDARIGFPSGALDELTTLAGTGQTFYQGVGTLPREFFIRLNTLVQDGDGTILANPRTVAMSGRESLINIRKTLNYFFNEGFDVSGRPIVKKSDISADTEGRIVPTLLADGTIHLNVDVKVGNFTFTAGQGLPELTTRQSTTEVTVQAGETLVLGGLRQQEMTNAVTKVPILGDVPLLGRLFRHDNKYVKHSVLTIFITPHVLAEGEPAPKWPTLDPNDHRIVPIMEAAPRKSKD